MRVVLARKRDRLGERALPVMADVARLETLAEIIGPDEFGERHRLLGKTARVSDGTGERAEGIVHQLAYSFGDRRIRLSFAVLVKRVKPALVVEEAPEMLLRQGVETGDRRNQDLLLALVMERPRKMVMIDHVRPSLGTNHDGHHVLPEIFA